MFELLSYMFLLPLIWVGMPVTGEAGPLLENVDAVAVLGAVLNPARRCPRLVRGVGTPLSSDSLGDFRTSIERGLIC